MLAGRSLSIALAAALFFAASARAETLTWDEAVRAASESNPDLSASRERVRRAEAERKAARANFLPEVSVGADYGRSGNDGGPGANAEDGESYGLSADARQSLYSGGRDAATLRRRGAELSGAAAALDEARASVSFDLKAAFARLLFAQDQLTLAQSIERRRAENVRLVGLRYEAGREHKGSFLRSRANASQARFEVSQAGRALRVAQRELARAMGRSQFDALIATGSLTAVPPAAAPDFRALAAEVPSVRGAQADILASRADLTSARGAFLPGVTASAGAGRRGDAWPPEDDQWNAGVSLSLPIFQGGRAAHGLTSAKASLRLTEDIGRATLEETALQLESSHASYSDAAERAQVQREFLEASLVRAEIARSQYTSGLLSFEDWDVIESDLISAQKNHLVSLRDAVVAEADWERTQGKGAVQ